DVGDGDVGRAVAVEVGRGDLDGARLGGDGGGGHEGAAQLQLGEDGDAARTVHVVVGVVVGVGDDGVDGAVVVEVGERDAVGVGADGGVGLGLQGAVAVAAQEAHLAGAVAGGEHVEDGAAREVTDGEADGQGLSDGAAPTAHAEGADGG